ncbi:MAG: lysyl-tRNA synthetase class 2 [Phenylobacterium sp.]|jgi:lysyl-tRNA synthetase class 2
MWQPNASINTLKQRAKILATIRQFFAEKSVMEVETPALSQATVTDLHLSGFITEFVGPGYAQGKTLYLQTSPEYAMKRLLAFGAGSIFQLAKAFRNEEAGRFHNPEFTLLEWYRIGFDDFALMAEVDELLQRVLNTDKAEQRSYQSVFIEYLNIDPLNSSIAQLSKQLGEALAQYGLADVVADESDIDTLLQLLFSEVIEPKIGREVPCFIYHFPASQASLAKLHQPDPRVAERFEVYFKGIELANGFHELTDADEQLRRFEQDNDKRLAAGLQAHAIDYNLIDALRDGLPDCAGVALGIDRLVMLAQDEASIDQVVTFTIDRA